MLVFRWAQLLWQERADLVEIFFAALSTVYLWIAAHFLRYFVSPDGPKTFVNMFDSILSLEKTLEGKVKVDLLNVI